MRDSDSSDSPLSGREQNAPRLIRVYDSRYGWTDSPRRSVLTPDVVDILRKSGATTVEVKLSKKVVRVSLSALDTEPTHPDAFRTAVR